MIFCKFWKIFSFLITLYALHTLAPPELFPGEKSLLTYFLNNSLAKDLFLLLTILFQLFTTCPPSHRCGRSSYLRVLRSRGRSWPNRWWSCLWGWGGSIFFWTLFPWTFLCEWLMYIWQRLLDTCRYSAWDRSLCFPTFLTCIWVSLSSASVRQQISCGPSYYYYNDSQLSKTKFNFTPQTAWERRNCRSAYIF